MNKNNRGFIGVAVGIVAAFLLGAGAYALYGASRAPEVAVAPIALPQADSAAQRKPDVNPVQESVAAKSVGSGACGLVVDSPAANAEVTFPLTITGRIDNTNAAGLGCGWGKLEGEAGSVQLYHNYQNKGWRTIGSGIPVPVADWMSAKTTFKVVVSFNNGGMGLPKGTPMKLVFTDATAKDGEVSDTFELPIVFKDSLVNEGI